MPRYDVCRQFCANGENCVIPEDFELLREHVESSIEGHTPQRVDSTNFGENVLGYCLLAAKYSDTCASLAPLFGDAMPSLELPATNPISF